MSNSTAGFLQLIATARANRVRREVEALNSNDAGVCATDAAITLERTPRQKRELTNVA